MWTEANDVFKEGDNWKLEDNILCLVSIGTGKPAIKSFGDDPIKLGKALLAIATDTEKRAEISTDIILVWRLRVDISDSMLSMD